ncbi:MAG: hypothetical protein ABI683_14305 [Ginsengibacter sp.]
MTSFILFFVLSTQLYGQDVNTFINQAKFLESTMNDEAAVAKYLEALQLQPGNIYAVCKVSELSTRVGSRSDGNKRKQDNYFNTAKTYAQAAIKLAPQNSESNFVMALVMGRDALSGSGKEKIEAVKKLKNYADLSIKYDPGNFKAWYVLGKWYYEVSALNYFERTAVKVFFGALPRAEITDAISCFEKSKSINPGFILNYLALAKAYKKQDEIATAKQNLSSMISLPDQTADDAKLKNEGRDLLKKWN